MENNQTAVQEQAIPNESNESPESTQKEPEQPKTYTEEEVNALIQEKINSEQDKARKEAERKANMSIEERERELLRREEAIRKTEMKNLALEKLSEKKIPPEMSEFLNYDNEENLNQSIEKFNTAFQQAVQWGVEERFRQSAYEPGKSSPMTPGLQANVPGSDDPFVQGMLGRTMRVSLTDRTGGAISVGEKLGERYI